MTVVLCTLKTRYVIHIQKTVIRFRTEMLLLLVWIGCVQVEVNLYDLYGMPNVKNSGYVDRVLKRSAHAGDLWAGTKV